MLDTVSAPPTRKRRTGWLVVAAVVSLLLLILIGAYASGGDSATGVGRLGMVAAGAAVMCAIVVLGLAISRRRFFGAPAWSFLILAVLLAGAGAGGIVSEPHLHTAQALDYKNGGNYAQAIAEYRKGDEEGRNAAISESYAKWGEQLATRKDFAAALDAYAHVLRPDALPNAYSDRAKAAIAPIYVDWGSMLGADPQKLDDAIAKYDLAIKDGNNPNAADMAKAQARQLLIGAGNTTLAAADFEKALKLYQRSTTYGGTETDLKLYLSKLYLGWGKKKIEGGDYSGGLALLEPNVDRSTPVDFAGYIHAIVDGYISIGNDLLTTSKYDEAVTTLEPVYTNKKYNTADNRAPLSTVLVKGIAEQAKSFGTAQQWDKAVDRYQTALDYALEAATKSGVQTNLIKALQAQGDSLETAKAYPNAIASYERALKLVGTGNDERKPLTARLSTLYREKGEDELAQNTFETAIATFQKALQTYPNPTADGAVRTDIAKSYLGWAKQGESAGQYQEALDRYKLVLREFGDQGDITKAANDAQPRVLFSLAAKYTNDRSYEQAIAGYQQVIKSFGGTSFAQDAQKALDAPQKVRVKVVGLNAAGIPNLKVRLIESWSVPDSTTYIPSGEERDFTTDANGFFDVTLAPGHDWLFASFDDKGYVALFNKENKPVNLIRAEPLRASEKGAVVKTMPGTTA